MRKKDCKIGPNSLAGIIVYPTRLQPKNPAVLIIHGWGEKTNKNSQSRRAEALADKGFICLVFDLRAHGESIGDKATISRQDHLEDAMAAYDFLAANPRVDPEQIGVFAASYGGFLAVMLTGERSVKWLGLYAPSMFMPAELNRPTPVVQAMKGLKKYRQKVHSSRICVELKVASEFQGDALIVQSENDQVISAGSIKSYRNYFTKRARTLRHEIIQGADHILSQQEWRDELVRLMVDFFVRCKQQIKADL